MKKILILPFLFLLLIPQLSLSQTDTLTSQVMPIVNQLFRNSQKLLYITQDLCQIEERVPLLERYYIRSLASGISELATTFSYEARLLGLTKIIAPNYKSWYCDIRIMELKALDRNMDLALKPIRIAYANLTNNAALVSVNRANEIIQSSYNLLNKCVLILQSAR